MQIDLNSDLGEGCSHDEELMPLITSANVACAAHSGDPLAMWRALQAAQQYGVQVGAHPGYFDREHFGRRELPVDPDRLCCELVYQIGAITALAQIAGVAVAYVKPHGALYHQACRDPQLAEAVIEAARAFQMAVMGLPGSQLAKAAGQCGLRFIAEGFADRRYQPDGSLVPRSDPNAFVNDPEEAAEQVQQVVERNGVESICVHGDNPEAVAFTRQLRAALGARGFAIRRFAL